MSTQIATLIEDGSSVVSLGEPVRFSWIDVPGVEPCEISAFVIGELPEWTGQPVESDALVLVDRSTLIRMAGAVRAAEITEDSGAYADAFLALEPTFVSVDVPGRVLFDVTELGGGPAQWGGQRIVEPVDPRLELAEKIEQTWALLASDVLEAIGALEPDGRGRFDAYLSQMFSESSRMLGMQSVPEWIRQLSAALRGQEEE